MHIFVNKNDSLMSFVGFLMQFVMRVCSGFVVQLRCRSVISIKLLCRLIEFALRRGCFPVNLLSFLRAPLCGRTYWGMLLSFVKALSSFIVHFKGTFTYCCYCFVYDLQIFNILQLLLIICSSSYICVSCFPHNRVWPK